MDFMEQLSLSKFYLWKRCSIYTYPWQRQFLNLDFLKYEQKRIIDVALWYHNFQKTKVGSVLGEVYYYVLPIDLPSNWKSAIALRGNFNYVYLSALKNCPQMCLIMLIPKDVPLPTDYSLIRIIRSKKDYIHNEKINEAKYVVNAEEYEEIDPSYVYVDVPYVKQSISKFIKENLISDKLIADSFQPTISGSPYVVNKKGGVSLSTFLGSSSFSEELITTLKLMQPPEFTDIQFQMSHILLEGKTFTDPTLPGAKFHVSEKPFIGKNYFSAFSTYDYTKLNYELVKRDMFKGEYSIACSLTPRGEKSDLLRDILSKFVKTEITQPFNTDELKWYDIDLKRTQRNITEDLWLQIVNQRQLSPIVVGGNQNISKLRESVLTEWKIILESLGLKKNVEHEAKVYSQVSFNNLIKVAQSIARDEQLPQINNEVLNKSFKLFVQNSEGLINNPQIQHYAKTIIPEMYESEKFNSVRAELSVNLLDVQSLFENVKGIFNDIYELQEYVDKLLREGYIFEPAREFYKWV